MAGLGSFMQGAMQGYAFASDAKDNKRRQKIEDERIKRDIERHGWAGENHELNKEISRYNLDTSKSNQAYTQAQRDREAAQRAEFARIYSETEDGYASRGRGVIPTEDVNGDPVVSSQGSIEGGGGVPAVDGGMGADELEAVRQARSEAAAPKGPGPYAPNDVNVAPNRGRGIMYDQNGGQVVDQNAPTRGQVSDPRLNTAPPGAAMPQVTADGVPINVPRTGGDPREAEAAQLAAIQRRRQEARNGPVAPANPGPDAQTNVRAQQAQMVQNPGRMGGYMDQDAIQMQPSQGGDRPPRSILPAQAQQPGQMEQPPAPGQPPVPAGEPPSVEAAAAATEETATKTPPKTNSKGVTKATPAQEERASQTFLEYYAENAAPKVVKMYLQQGDVEKAQAFTEWSDQVETKATMKSWSKAVFAASIGDEDGLLDHLSDTYNSYDDGYKLDRKNSGFTRAPDGTILGASLTFENTQTGETFVREYEDQGDLIEQGLYAMAPEKIFEELYGQVLKARELEAGNGARKLIEDRADAMAVEARAIRKSIDDQQIMNPNAPRPTEAEIDAMAAEAVERRYRMAAGRDAQAVAPQAVPDWPG